MTALIVLITTLIVYAIGGNISAKAMAKPLVSRYTEVAGTWYNEYSPEDWNHYRPHRTQRVTDYLEDESFRTAQYCLLFFWPLALPITIAMCSVHKRSQQYDPFYAKLREDQYKSRIAELEADMERHREVA